ncbi:DNA-processing protein DprA [Ammonifex thiophilus]|uniref:DNA-protecting protein DprA n=1 Tax=Ammonifex thiophilus TaxID=444093 RepID=A0A3D8P455_9THEO|nr:DNA-processing protein DprA [Ammonifex thiophilus]RDV82439.1 DNA-protecting protein DprA [Ammonifex thiophilus]
MNSAEERLYCLAWQLLLPGQSRRVKELISFFGSAREAFLASPRHWASVVGERLAEALAGRRAKLDLKKEEERLRKLGVRYVTLAEPDYPALLREIDSPPVALFYLGEIRREERAVAIVGTRRPTRYGREVAESLASDLARFGVTVVSGLARGIDAAAHRGALSGGGRTLAVLGTGCDRCYPRENWRLWQEIEKKGALISEFPLGTEARPWHFPVRNRIIAGLVHAVIVVEAPEKSGALITADLALEYGREVLAVPGRVTTPQAKGSHLLLKQGAYLVEKAEDVLEVLGWEIIGAEEEEGLALNPEEEEVVSLLAAGFLSLEELVERGKMSVDACLSLLSMLELKGVVRPGGGGTYLLTRQGENLLRSRRRKGDPR